MARNHRDSDGDTGGMVFGPKTILQDPEAQSADPNLPAFIARPAGAHVYHGFPLVTEIETDGFVFGAISSFLEPDSRDGCTFGDGFVQAPDGSRAGLIWAVADYPYVEECSPPERRRWGVYNVGFVRPIKSMEDLVFCFRQCLPELKEIYAATHRAAKPRRRRRRHRPPPTT